MPKSSTNSTNPSTHITQVRQGSVITGNMVSSHSIRVDGFVTGDLISEEKIIIGGHGEIGGNLSGTDINIEGYVNGDVVANGHLHLSAQSKVYGKVFAKNISVEKGAEMNGKVTVGNDIELPDVENSSPSRSTKSVTMENLDDDSKDNYGSVAW